MTASSMCYRSEVLNFVLARKYEKRKKWRRRSRIEVGLEFGVRLSVGKVEMKMEFKEY